MLRPIHAPPPWLHLRSQHAWLFGITLSSLGCLDVFITSRSYKTEWPLPRKISHSIWTMSSNYYSRRQEGWNLKNSLGDEGLASPYTIAAIVLNGIWLLALLGVAFWAAFVSKSRNGIAASVFKLHKFWIAIVLAIV